VRVVRRQQLLIPSHAHPLPLSAVVNLCLVDQREPARCGRLSVQDNPSTPSLLRHPAACYFLTPRQSHAASVAPFPLVASSRCYASAHPLPCRVVWLGGVVASSPALPPSHSSSILKVTCRPQSVTSTSSLFSSPSPFVVLVRVFVRPHLPPRSCAGRLSLLFHVADVAISHIPSPSHCRTTCRHQRPATHTAVVTLLLMLLLSPAPPHGEAACCASDRHTVPHLT
jgi:hypothetical protein